ncbi:hypothetical protein M3Y99_01456400 [Aphelenchoides fujianensis]|nr:hypothetical protein M3Y99_01456400 [Aphelenchoides fujianensis]
MLWTMVERRIEHSDLIRRPSLCPSACQRLFRANRLNLRKNGGKSGAEEVWNSFAPVLASVWPRSIRVNDRFESRQRPAISTRSGCRPCGLPETEEFIRFPGQILWQESRIKVKAKFGPRCNVTSARTLRHSPQWEEVSPALFRLGWNEEQAAGGVIWTGTDDEKDLLVGALVQIRLDCVGAEANAHCLSFRVTGQLMFPVPFHPTHEHSRSRVETAIIILLALLLFFSAVGYTILWKVRWKMKKQKLISSLQLQFLYHLKQQEKEKAVIDGMSSPYYVHRSHHHYQALAAAQQQRAEMGGAMGDLPPNSQQPIIAKRKLYFSSEFFEKEHLENPPEMAEQFLQDLRKMIDIAKQRIQMRRHVQQLSSIAEEPPEVYQEYMRAPSRGGRVDEQKPTINVTSSASIRLAPKGRPEEHSPKSTKSDDSGHESTESSEKERSDSDSNHSPNGQPAEEGRKRPADLIVGRKPSPMNSRIPMPAVGQKSPRVANRPLSIPTPPNANGSPPAPPLPPRNLRLMTATPEGLQPPSPPKNPPPVTPPKSLQLLNFQPVSPQHASPSKLPTTSGCPGQSRTAEARRKAYAVFPTDAAMLKKSLPRRSQKPAARRPTAEAARCERRPEGDGHVTKTATSTRFRPHGSSSFVSIASIAHLVD